VVERRFIAFIRVGTLLRPNGPVPGILAARHHCKIVGVTLTIQKEILQISSSEKERRGTVEDGAIFRLSQY
jgi:hypothetical protein